MGVLQSTVNTRTLISEVQGDWTGKTEGESGDGWEWNSV